MTAFDPSGVGSPACRIRCFGQQLVRGQEERFRAAAGIGQAQHVQHRRGQVDQRVGLGQRFDQIEDHVGPQPRQFARAGRPDRACRPPAAGSCPRRPRRRATASTWTSVSWSSGGASAGTALWRTATRMANLELESRSRLSAIRTRSLRQFVLRRSSAGPNGRSGRSGRRRECPRSRRGSAGRNAADAGPARG